MNKVPYIVHPTEKIKEYLRDKNKFVFLVFLKIKLKI